MENQDSKNKKPNFQLKGPKKSDLQNNPGCSRAIFWVLSLLMIFTVISLFWSPEMKNKPNEKNLSEIVKLVRENQVKKITIENDRLVIAKLKNGEEVQATKEQSTSIVEYGLDPNKVNIDIEYKEGSAIASSILIQFVPLLIFIGLFYFLIRQTTNANFKAMSFGQSKAKLASTSKVKFADVAGLKEAKLELEEEVEFLKNPARFKKLGAEIPKGVLLIGPPGTGKTLLAKAVAGEASVPFFSISASEFVEMFVGVGASRVRDLFAKAKKNAPSIIFIDELDAIGRQRGSGIGGSHDEREQTLNQILVEMDGFDTDDSVIVIAATNRPDVLDPALLRPGRFDRRVVVDLPTKTEREEILKIHARNKPLDENIKIDKVAGQSVGFSGADLKNVMNEAAILAARENHTTISQSHLHQAVEKVILGPERKSRVLSDEEKKITAVHEIGHAIVGHLLPECDNIHKVSIISRGMALGVTWSLPSEDRHITPKEKFEQEIAQLLAGRVAEKIVFGRFSTGAANDLRQATKMAKRMVTEFGMNSSLGARTFGEKEELIFLGREISEQKDYSEKTAEIIDKEISSIIEQAEKVAEQVISTHRPELDELTEILLQKETIEGDELDKILPKK
ncbi:MAG: ATP-dependent zinc metalloprotease FtsH [Berkelbacteria bacterium GW2011_GWA2_38_9]|uniref:ATP-dependent zinc metalloprotease FtsH n=1 Tax=Berkelbacteria bacterium GW2011_GWA2_38_9 TaxID=1618334 RepID=A0A0G0LBS3_9BACT|nr:MAG: ATP-dependent zinc metalloprotease FtsH [Berkelbacteria bacterium GW2011_GWA2_38_9]